MSSTSAVITGGGSPLTLLARQEAGAGPVGQPGRSTMASGAPGAAQAKPAAATAKASAPASAKATTAKKTTGTKKPTAAKKPTTSKASGYATRLPADYAFLRDPKLSIEEKLSRFIGLVMARSEQDLLRQMEKMAPGSTASGSGGTSGTGGSAAPKKSKFSLWSIAKSAIPALGLASQVIGDAQLKKLASQVSGPVLAAACTAVGLPALAPLAQQYGPQLVGMLTKDITVDLGLLTGGASGSTSGSGGTSATGGTAKAGAAKAGAADPSTSEKAQLMELQRLQDRDKELFTLFSNMLKAMHDARMTSIQNIR